MTSDKRKTEARVLLLITTPKLAQKAAALLDGCHVPLQYQFHGQGTASSEILETLGLGNTEKILVLCALPRFLANELLRRLRKELRLGVSTNSGIAVTLPINGGSGRLVRQLEALGPTPDNTIPPERSHVTMSECNYVMILTIVDQGFSDDVMSAARSAGATGGTVFNSRRLSGQETMQFWGLRVQEEREIVAILAEAERKVAIMQAISQACGIHSQAHGTVLSLPVDQALGLD